MLGLISVTSLVGPDVVVEGVVGGLVSMTDVVVVGSSVVVFGGSGDRKW